MDAPPVSNPGGRTDHVGAEPDTTILELRVDADVRRRAEKLWTRAMALFWSRFGSWCERAIPNNRLR